MRVLLSAEQDEIKQVARRFFEREQSFDDLVVAVAERKPVRAAWERLSSELGAQALMVPESYGGLGCTFLDLAMVIEEAGRTLSPLPLLSSSVSTAVLLHCGDAAARDRWLPSIADGSLVVATAFAEVAAPWDAGGIASVADRHGGGWRVTGAKDYVVDGDAADAFLVLARVDSELALFSVDASDAVLRRPDAADPTRSFASVRFDASAATPVGSVGQGDWVFDIARDVGQVALALEAVGGARKMLEVAVAYASTREQFGKPIGSFQAVKHKCADMLLRVEAATSASHHAAWAVDGDPAGRSSAARIAKSYATDAYFFVAAEAIQILGGIGFTWEHPAHLFFKRAKSSQLLFGSSSHQYQAMARGLGL